MKKGLRNKKTLRRGTRRVEAWIYTVINPLIEALDVERSLLRDHNWTWRYHTKSLEFIQPLERYIDPSALPIFKEFFKENPQIERDKKRHESLRVALLENCQTAFDYLLNLKTFQLAVRSLLSRYTQEEPGRGYPGGATPEEDFSKVIAQYVVNGTKELPEHYTTSKFWYRFGEEFFRLRTGGVFEKLDASGEQLKNEDDRLLITLENLRSNLCKEYDIPPAPVPYYDWTRQER